MCGLASPRTAAVELFENTLTKVVSLVWWPVKRRPA